MKTISIAVSSLPSKLRKQVHATVAASIMAADGRGIQYLRVLLPCMTCRSRMRRVLEVWPRGQVYGIPVCQACELEYALKAHRVALQANILRNRRNIAGLRARIASLSKRARKLRATQKQATGREL